MIGVRMRLSMRFAYAHLYLNVVYPITFFLYKFDSFDTPVFQ